jgi:hypothetical protein
MDVCILDSSQIVIAFNPMGSKFFMFFAVFNIHYNSYIIIIIIATVYYHITLKNLQVCVDFLC